MPQNNRNYSRDTGSRNSFLQWLNKKVLGWTSLSAKMTGKELTGAEREANQFTAEQAQINRDWETEMANTAYQRTVTDLRAAGLNPALAYGNSVDPTPSGSAANSVSPGSAAGLLDLILQMKSLKIQEKLANAEVGLKVASTQKVQAETPWIDRLNAITEQRGSIDINQVKQAITNMQADYDLKIRQAKNEDEKRLLIQADAALRKAQERQVSVLIEYDRAFREAQTENEKAQCNLSKLQYLYNSRLWSDDYVNSIKDYAIRQADSQDLRNQIDSATLDILKGDWINTKEMTKGEKFLANILNLFMATNAAVKR